jgi:hypothetical protein
MSFTPIAPSGKVLVMWSRLISATVCSLNPFPG